MFQSREVVVVFSLVITFYAFKLLWPLTYNSIQQMMKLFLGQITTLESLTITNARIFFEQGCLTFVATAMPLLIICGMVTILVTIAQTRMLFTMKAAEFKISRLNPIQGFKKMFSIRGIVELLKSLMKITVLGVIIYQNLGKEFALMPRLMQFSSLESVMAYIGGIVLSIAKTAAIIMAFIAAFDYLYQWWDYEKNLRMSKQELKEEFKQTEGDPQIKGKIKERQQQQARQRMMQNVPNADVVIRNPTHFAVAIQYRPERNNAPVVVAKGMDSLALKIVQVAEENGVMTIENKPLARGLYDTVDLDCEIPDQFYQPVAEVLAFVYNLKKKDLK